MSSVIEGWLSKQKTGKTSSWGRRWFKIVDKDLIYSNKPSGAEKGKINIPSITNICEAPDCKKQPAFKLETSGKTYYLVADTPKLVKDWISTIQAIKAGQTVEKKAQFKATLDDFEVLKVLGRGTYGKVQLVKYKKNGQLYAMKSMSKKVLEDSDQIDQIITERGILVRTRHPFLVGAHYCFQTDAKLYMVLDYVPGGELFGRLKDETTFPESRVRLYAAEIALGLGQLHSLGLIYRDLKPENILIDMKGHIRLTDFGLAKEVSGDQTATTFCGTPEYLAPEMLQRQPYTKAVDWWSYGVLIFEMLTGLPPFYDENINAMYRAILNDDIEFPSSMSAEAKDFVSKLLDRNPSTRLGSSDKDVEEIKAHPFFAAIDWKAVYDKKYEPEWIPPITDATDVSQFDDEFTSETPAFSFADGSLINKDTQDTFTNFTCDAEETSLLDSC
ncbi:AGC family protein kinase [Histomonas meleagridis]|uniref:AGC family protein kinase n=1 Tax=Histomonas meleagridis TaxID=135588 RepID=UPI003559AE3E|nr:AGC family protein kinase [Histomonas meleagridis]KAH0805223.1 AGC family protein kinase [Histomonas meleagridis]